MLLVCNNQILVVAYILRLKWSHHRALRHTPRFSQAFHRAGA